MRSLFLCVLIGLLTGCQRADFLKPLPADKVEKLWRFPAAASFDELFAASLTAQRSDDIERAVFFLWCAQVRLEFERQLFPPTAIGGDSPILPLYAMTQTTSRWLVPTLYASPSMHRKVVDKFRDYVPESGTFYRAFWKYLSKGDQLDAQKTAKRRIAAAVAHSEAILRLTEIEEYLDSLVIYADYSDQSKDRSDRLRAALEKMRQIEEYHRIESGMVPRKSHPIKR